jgi:hypothetical protein
VHDDNNNNNNKRRFKSSHAKQKELKSPITSEQHERTFETTMGFDTTPLNGANSKV